MNVEWLNGFRACIKTKTGPLFILTQVLNRGTAALSRKERDRRAGSWTRRAGFRTLGRAPAFAQKLWPGSGARHPFDGLGWYESSHSSTNLHEKISRTRTTTIGGARAVWRVGSGSTRRKFDQVRPNSSAFFYFFAANSFRKCEIVTVSSLPMRQFVTHTPRFQSGQT